MNPSLNRTVIMSDALNFSVSQAINPHYFDPIADPQLAQREHDAIRTAFEAAGITVIRVPSPTDSQDGVYTANWALVRGTKAILARLPEVRKAEEAHAKTILEAQGLEVIEVPGGLKFSGQGDALACGEFLFCGSGYRSDEAAQDFAARTLGYHRIQLHTIPQRDNKGNPVNNSVSGWADSFFYDIDLALSVLRAPSDEQPGLIAYCPDAFDEESQAILADITTLTHGQIEAIPIELQEAEKAFAANLVSTGDVVVMSAHAPKLTRALQERGLTVVSPTITELVKGGGYIRCTSLTLA